MLDKNDELRSLIYTVTELLTADKLNSEADLLSKSQLSIEQTGYDNWNGGLYAYTIYLTVSIETFVNIRSEVQNIESKILERFRTATRHIENESIECVKFIPKGEPKIKPPLEVYSFTAQYRLTIGNHRVLYDVDDDTKTVWILALRKRNERTYK